MEVKMRQVTSTEAYESVKPYIPTISERIVDYIGSWGPNTCDDLEYQLSLSHQTCSACIRGLVKQGMLEDSGEKEKTRTGRRAIMWKLAEKSHESVG